MTPSKKSGVKTAEVISLNAYRCKKHCDGLFLAYGGISTKNGTLLLVIFRDILFAPRSNRRATIGRRK
jgi:hypothetical protein